MTDKSYMALTGGCLCGTVRHQAWGQPLSVVHCHCSMCRRCSGAALATFVGFPKQAVEFTHGSPTMYHSSSTGRRRYCRQCGSSLSYYDENDPNSLWLTVGSLDHPGEVNPTEHWYATDTVEWIHMEDDLPHYPEYPPA
ncbi:MAG: GFA family protein [Gammaproteobacteria bacterium]|nr:GFA family protein [Gammaproteobacteria bacterium]MDH3468289.1 GFA family protein [Gammaproteobacteria bacterium]